MIIYMPSLRETTKEVYDKEDVFKVSFRIKGIFRTLGSRTQVTRSLENRYQDTRFP